MKKERCDDREVVEAPSAVRRHLATIATSQNSQVTNSSTDEALVGESVKLMKASINTVEKILPAADSELVGGFFADLLDLWETGQRLDKELRKLAQFHVPYDPEQLRELLIWISAIQIDMASYWIGEIKKDIPKLLQELDK